MSEESENISGPDTEEDGRLNTRRLGSLSIDLDRDKSNDEVMVYQVEAEFKDEKTSFELPRYDTHLGWIEVFGLPPFNEWVLLDEFQYINKNFSGRLNEKMYSESIEVEKKGVTGHRINLQRTSGDEEEYYTVRTFNVPGAGHNSIFECMSSEGVYTAVINKNKFENPEENLDELTSEEREYFKDVKEDEGAPDVLTVKKSEINGPMPAIYRKMFPFWDKTDHSDSMVRSVELGYLDRGDNKTDLDKSHGDWFKLFTFQDFDHTHLEVREGNWESTTDWFKGDKENTKEHYEKHIYRYKGDKNE